MIVHIKLYVDRNMNGWQNTRIINGKMYISFHSDVDSASFLVED